MSSTISTYYYSLHGITLAVSCDPDVADALQSRLEHFAIEYCDSPQLTFSFYPVPRGGAHIIEKPSGPTRPVYDPPLGEVVYAEASDQLYISYGDRVRVLCDLTAGRAQVSTLESERSNLWLLTHPLFTLALIEFLKRRCLYPLHAAALALGEKCILLAGTSGAGKSTLAIVLLRDGYGFLGDDLVFLEQGTADLQALGFPEEIDVTDDTVRLFPELDKRIQPEQRSGWRKRQVSADRGYNSKIVLKAHPSVLIFPRVANADTSILTPMMAEEAFMELVPNVMLTEARSSQAHLDVLAELVKQCACYRLETGRDVNALPRMLRQLFEP